MPANSKKVYTDIKATSQGELYKEAASRQWPHVEIIFHAPFDQCKHGHLSHNMKITLKRMKRELFWPLDEADFILKSMNNHKDIHSVMWCKK